MASLLLVIFGITAMSPPFTTRSKARTSSTRYDAYLFRANVVISDRKQRLKKQLEDLNVPFTDDFDAALGAADHVVDAIFGT